MLDSLRTPKVSVCVITFNQERFIGECLQSIVDQRTSFDFEIIIGDDCSTDGTRGIILDFERKHPEKIYPVFHNERINGGCNNYRVVHQLARGKYIAHMDGDDIMEKKKLQLQSDFLDQNPNCSMVAHSAFTLNLEGRKLLSERQRRREKAGMTELLKEQCFFVHSSKMYRSSIRDKSAVLSQPVFIDFELHIECAGHGEIGFINIPLVVYRETNNSISRGQNHKIFELVKCTLRGYDLAAKYGVSAETIAHEKCAYLYKSAVFFLRKGSAEFGKKCFEKYDEQPVNLRPVFYGIFLFGNFKSVRIQVCKLIAFLRSRFN
jgi:glycosyltransferase involved in cell wall biosynthesis